MRDEIHWGVFCISLARSAPITCIVSALGVALALCSGPAFLIRFEKNARTSASIHASIVPGSSRILRRACMNAWSDYLME